MDLGPGRHHLFLHRPYKLHNNVNVAGLLLTTVAFPGALRHRTRVDVVQSIFIGDGRWYLPS